MVKGFSKMYNLSFLDTFVLPTFLIYYRILQKKTQFLQICNFLQILKVEHKSFFNDVSFVIFGHQQWDLGGGGKLTPQRFMVWKYPARIRVNLYSMRDHTICDVDATLQ